MPLISLRQLLDHAAENNYGIPAFNINNLEQPSCLVIYNTIGKKLMESNINKKNNLIQLNQYSTGIYTVQIYNDNYSYSKKIYIH